MAAEASEASVDHRSGYFGGAASIFIVSIFVRLHSTVVSDISIITFNPAHKKL